MRPKPIRSNSVCVISTIRAARAVIDEVVRHFGWQPHAARKPGHGVGFSFAQYKNLMAYFAIAMEVSVERDTGQVQIERVVCAVDCGQIVNPNGVRNQIRRRHPAIGELDAVRGNHFRYAPHHEFRLERVSGPALCVGAEIDRRASDRPARRAVSRCVGEASQGPTSAVLANAIFDATGVRLRDLPIGGKRLKAALAT